MSGTSFQHGIENSCDLIIYVSCKIEFKTHRFVWNKNFLEKKVFVCLIKFTVMCENLEILAGMTAHQMRSIKNTISQLITLYGKHSVRARLVFRRCTTEDYYLECARRTLYAKKHGRTSPAHLRVS